MNSNQLKEQIKKLPTRPGIYLFKNSKNKPLYIGKALNLKNRLKSYLKTSDPRLGQMILETKKINFIKTESDIEALILESQYIKKYRPDFNIVLRDDKQYGFVGFTHSTSSGQAEEYPKIFITHQPIKNEGFIGPFTDIGALKITLRLLRRIFPYCTCKQTHHNYCLNYHIGKCIGVCCLKHNEHKNKEHKRYLKSIKAIKDILSGKKSSLIKKLEKEMKILSDQQEYEQALELQYKIEKLKRVFQNATIIENLKLKNENYSGQRDKLAPIELQKLLKLKQLPARIEAYDIANIQGKYAVGAMVVFENGEPNKNEYRKFKIYTKNTADDTAMLKEVLTRRFNHPEWTMPDLILIDGGKAQFNTAKSIIKNIPIIALTKNEKHQGHKIITQSQKEVSLSELSTPLKNLILQINSEAHRFAISYYRKLHAKSIK
ncbi:MAG: GIY-YIG nuclease family protein [bacterium]|nr:GIY-YIG nuclease family protein [bacterium]